MNKVKIYNYQEHELELKNSMIEALGLAGRNQVISVAGAGGKTSTILRLEEEYKQQSQAVIVTTTTHMKRPEETRVYDRNEEEVFWKELQKSQSVWAGRKSSEGKFISPEASFFQRILESRFPVLIEADGAKRHPVKVPAQHEPVIPKETETVLYVFGMDAVGQRIGDVCHRPENAGVLLGKSTDSILTCSDIVLLALSRKGGLKGVGGSMEYHIILNKIETEDGMRYGLEIARMIAEKSSFQCHLTSYLQ